MDNNFLFSRFLKLDEKNDSSENSQTIDEKAAENRNLQSLQSLLTKNEQSAEIDNSDSNATFSSEELNSITVEILEQLKKVMPIEKFNAFFNDKFVVTNLSEESIDFLASTSFVKKMVETYYIQQLQESVVAILGKQFQISISLIETSSNSMTNQQSPTVPCEPITDIEKSNYNVQRGLSVKETRFTINDTNELRPNSDDLRNTVNSKVIDHMGTEGSISCIDPKKTFENFIVGPCNNMAHASCLAVSENPGKVYPSLYIYSGSGLGKTHLLYAVANNIRELQPGLNICIMTARNFMNEVVDAIRNNKRDLFRKKYSEQVDVLMIDDIHELKNKTSTQEEFFHVFNELHNNNKQLIFTSDKLPKEIDGIEERIKSRLSWGLVIDIQQPDVETRIAILKRKAIEEDIYLPDDVVTLIASAIKSNIRELEGSLIRLGAYSSLFKIDIDVEIAKEQLKLTEIFDPKALSLESISKTASSYFRIPVADLRSKARQKDVTLARHIAMYFSYQFLKATLNEIGKYYGNRDHTSVLHGVDKIRKLIKIDSQISQYVIDIERDL